MSKTTILYKDVAPGAAEDAAFSSASAASFSDMALSGEYESVPIATCELNGFGLDGTSTLLSDGQTVPFLSSGTSNENCVFTSQTEITVEFDSQHTSVGVTLIFSQSTGVYCRSVNIKWYQGTTLKAHRDFAPDNAVYFCQQNVSSYNKVVITLKETNLPYQYARLEQVVFGVLRSFGMTEIRNAKITNQMNHIAAEIPISTLNWTLDSRDDVDYMFQLRQPVEVRNNNSLIGVYYINEHSRSAERLYAIKCQDAFGILDGTAFSGGVYSSHSAKQLLQDIVGGDFTVEFAADVSDTTLTGVIASCTKREAIQQVLFAWGVCASTDGVSGVRVFSTDSVPISIGEDRTYTGAAVSTTAVVTQVTVTAHTYTQDSSGSVEVNGAKYKDTQTEYTVSNPNVTASDKKNVVEVTGATLVSTAIGQATAQRVYNYYMKRNTTKAKIVCDGELLGDCVSIPNSWGGTSAGNISKMEITLSNTVAANCEVI